MTTLALIFSRIIAKPGVCWWRVCVSLVSAAIGTHNSSLNDQNQLWPLKSMLTNNTRTHPFWMHCMRCHALWPMYIFLDNRFSSCLLLFIFFHVCAFNQIALCLQAQPSNPVTDCNHARARPCAKVHFRVYVWFLNTHTRYIFMLCFFSPLSFTWSLIWIHRYLHGNELKMNNNNSKKNNTTSLYLFYIWRSKRSFAIKLLRKKNC